MKGQITMFEGQNRFRIDKPIRLIELFAGDGSQSLALKYLGAKFERIKAILLYITWRETALS